MKRAALCQKYSQITATILALLACPVTAALAADQCANTGGTGGCFASIQSAIDAAGAGDTVSIHKGRYNQQFEVPLGKDGMTVQANRKGKKGKVEKVMIDIDDANDGVMTTGVIIAASDVVITGLEFRNGDSIGIYVDASASNTLLDSLTMGGMNNDCIQVHGPSTTLRNSKLLGCGNDAVESEPTATGLTLRENEIRHCDSGCFELTTDDVTLADNFVGISEDGACIEVTGASANIHDNQVGNCDYEGIRVKGDDATVADNTIEHAEEEGVWILGANASVTGNVIRYGGANAFSAIDITGDNAIVSNNNTTTLKGNGVGIEGANAVIDGNTIQHGGPSGEAGIFVLSAVAGVTVTNNTINSAITAIRIEADDAVVSANNAYSTLGDGIRIVGANAVIDGNEVRGGGVGGQAGIYNHSAIPGVSVTNNTVESTYRNGIDITNLNPVIVGNVVRGTADYGMRISCSSPADWTALCQGGEIRLNQVSEATGDSAGISIRMYLPDPEPVPFPAINLLIEGNTSERSADDGFELAVGGSTIRGNLAMNNGGDQTEGGFFIGGTSNLVENNQATGNHGNGFKFYEGGKHTLIDNYAWRNTSHGFVLAADMTVTNNVAEDNNAIGFQIDTGIDGVTLTGNQSIDHHQDYCDESLTTVDGGGNSFAVGTIGCVPVK
jgi:hypothetical protein